MSCSGCPRRGSPCLGEEVPRLCELVDPSHPDYRPEYLASLEPPESYPPLATQIANFAGAMVDFAKDGFSLADAAETGRRLAICHECPLYDAVQARCKRCGCWMAGKAKVKRSKCPENKW